MFYYHHVSFVFVVVCCNFVIILVVGTFILVVATAGAASGSQREQLVGHVWCDRICLDQPCTEAVEENERRGSAVTEGAVGASRQRVEVCHRKEDAGGAGLIFDQHYRVDNDTA